MGGGDGDEGPRGIESGVSSLVSNPRFSPDNRGLIGELVARLADRCGLAQLARLVDARLGRPGITPDIVSSWASGRGGPPPGDVTTIFLQLASEHEDLALLVDMLIGRRPEQACANLDDVDRRRLPWS